jgi:NADPH-dependent 2,4-dienoyl-CoA reductase/sulfur reductase-like enzyme
VRFLIISGSDAGISAALRAHELRPDAEATVALSDDFPNYSICGLPFFISGETADWRDLAHRTTFDGVRVLKQHRALTVDPNQRVVMFAAPERTLTIGYDRLLIATGARPARPPITGLDLPGVHVLHTMADSFRLHDAIVQRKPRSAAIVGSGYIGAEMADALTHKGIAVTVAGRSPCVLPTVDFEFGRIIEQELSAKGVRVASGVEIADVTEDGLGLAVRGADFECRADLVVVAAGVTPNAELGVAAGIATGAKGALRVDRRMMTNVPDVYAAGDCAQTWHRILERHDYLPLGTTAHKQGRVAGENAVGGNREFAGTVGTQVVKIFDLVVARTGLLNNEARESGFDAVTVESIQKDHKAYYPGAKDLRIRVTGDRRSRRLLGAQIVGPWGTEAAKRIDVFAFALYAGARVDEINDVDLSYTPPVGSPWDAVQMASQAWASQVERAPL